MEKERSDTGYFENRGQCGADIDLPLANHKHPPSVYLI